MPKKREAKDSIKIVKSYLAGKIDYDISVSELAKHLRVIRAYDKTDFISILQKFPHNILGDLVLELPEHCLKEIIENIPSKQLNEAIADLESDDATDLMQHIEEVDLEKAEEILSCMNEESKEEIKRLISYSDEKAGAYMQTEVFSAPYNEKISLAIERLKELKNKGKIENVHQVSVIGKLGRLIYTISLEDLITFNFDRTFKEELDGKEEEFKSRYIRDDEEISKVIEIFEDYDLSALPIVDYHGKLLGRITSDDIYDIIENRATDQIYKLAGVDDEAEHVQSIYEAGKSRLAWLSVNLLTAIAASAVIGQFEAVLSAYVALAILMPIVASMGGNAGTQSLTVMVRQLAIGEVDRKNAKEAIKKEIILASLNGVVFAIAIGFIALAWFGDGRIGFVIAAAMIINLISAGLVGSMVPLALKRVGVDPAIGSTVILTTSTDIIGFLSFLGLASIVLM